jgi:hypothetical protein
MQKNETFAEGNKKGKRSYHILHCIDSLGRGGGSEMQLLRSSTSKEHMTTRGRLRAGTFGFLG